MRREGPKKVEAHFRRARARNLFSLQPPRFRWGAGRAYRRERVRMMKSDDPKRGRGALSAHKGAVFFITGSAFSLGSCVRIQIQHGITRRGAPRRVQCVFSARAGATFIFTHQPASSLGKNERIQLQCRMKRWRCARQSRGAFLAHTAMHLFSLCSPAC